MFQRRLCRIRRNAFDGRSSCSTLTAIAFIFAEQVDLRANALRRLKNSFVDANDDISGIQGKEGRKKWRTVGR